MENQIKHEIILLIEKFNLSSFIEFVQQSGDVLFFGGVLRSILNKKSIIRDFDIIVDSKDKNTILDAINLFSLSYVKNKFGGYKIDFGNIKMDIWYLEETWAFKNGLVECSTKNLTKSVFLNIDGIVFNYTKNELFDDEYQKACKLKMIDVVLMQNPDIHLNLLRALIIRNDYEFQFSKKIEMIYLDLFRNEKSLFIENIKNRQETRYKGQKIHEDFLIEFIDNLEFSNGLIF